MGVSSAPVCRIPTLSITLTSRVAGLIAMARGVCAFHIGARFNKSIIINNDKIDIKTYRRFLLHYRFIGLKGTVILILLWNFDFEDPFFVKN
jgi:hypothetical protein